jgi:hypothetical protein
MRSALWIVLVGSALALPCLAGCGEDRAERGAVAAPEVGTPESAREMRETEAQREAETNRGEDQQEQKALDEAAEEEKKEGGER